MNNEFDDKKQSSHSHVIFGTYLRNLRKAKGVSSEQVAKYLGITLEEYKSWEDGSVLPDNEKMIELSRYFGMPIGKLKEVALHDRRKNFRDQVELEGAMSLDRDVAKAIERVKATYKKETGRDLSHAQRLIFGALKRQLYRIFFPPLQPLTCLLILNALHKAENKHRFLHEIIDFILPGETLAGYIASNFDVGHFLWFTANLFFFQENPSTNLLDCLNRLTIAQCKELILLGASEAGIYTNDQELPILQQIHQHCRLAVLMARELRSELPQDINYDHLEMALLLQGGGHQVLYTCLQPSIRVLADETEPANEETSTSDTAYAALDEELFKIIDYELHAVASGMLAANWHAPKEVIEALITHHNHPVKEVSRLCALIKIINYFVDLDFPNMSKEDIEEWLLAYPQIKIAPEILYRILLKLSKDKIKFIERTSVLALESSEVVRGHIRKRMEDTNKPIFFSASSSRPKWNFISDQGFLKAVAITALVLLDDLKNEWADPRPEEKMNDFLHRSKLFHLRRAYAKKQDLQSIADRFGITEAEIRDLLKLI